jgi:hypothetical protein
MRNRLDICNRLLGPYHEECDAFMSRIVTSYWKSVHHYVPESKFQSMR